MRCHEVPWRTISAQIASWGYRTKDKVISSTASKPIPGHKSKYQGSTPLLCQAPHTRMGPPNCQIHKYSITCWRKEFNPIGISCNPNGNPQLMLLSINSIRSGQDFELPYDCISNFGNKDHTWSLFIHSCDQVCMYWKRPKLYLMCIDSAVYI